MCCTNINRPFFVSESNGLVQQMDAPGPGCLAPWKQRCSRDVLPKRLELSASRNQSRYWSQDIISRKIVRAVAVPAISSAFIGLIILGLPMGAQGSQQATHALQHFLDFFAHHLRLLFCKVLWARPCPTRLTNRPEVAPFVVRSGWATIQPQPTNSRLNWCHALV
jgi:hypothetical protein